MFQKPSVKTRTQGSPESQLRNCGKWTTLFGLLLVLLSCPSSSMQAQTSQGTITGRVADSNGAVIANATVRVTKNDTQTTSSTVSNGSGVYIFQSLNPGQYTVKVASQGFQTRDTTGITVGAAQTVTVNVTLQIGQASETVNVEAQNALLSTDTSDVTTTVDHQIVANLPYPERSSLEAALLVPGVLGDPSVPGGIFSWERPSIVGTSIFEPRDASVIVTGTVT